jgi:hypothetical protein
MHISCPRDLYLGLFKDILKAVYISGWCLVFSLRDIMDRGNCELDDQPKRRLC